MKNQLHKMFYAFILLMIVVVSANAQIVYTDVIPDLTFNTNGAIYHLDLDTNGTIEFDIVIFTIASSHPTAKITITPTSGNFFAQTNTYPSSLNQGVSIGTGNTWSGTSYSMAIDAWGVNQHSGGWVHGRAGNWLNITDHYLGLKFSSGGNTFYGWARLDSHVNGNGTADFTIKDYAYNSTPNQFILAGDSGNGISGIFASSNNHSITTLFPNPSTDHMIVNFSDHINKAELTITDIAGKEVYAITVSEKQSIEVNTNNFSEGVYFLHIQTMDFIETKRFVVEK